MEERRVSNAFQLRSKEKSRSSKKPFGRLPEIVVGLRFLRQLKGVSKWEIMREGGFSVPNKRPGD